MSKGDPSATTSGQTAGGEARLPRASAARFSLYLRRLENLHHAGVATVSSGQLGEALGIADTQVRKDLAKLGNLGHPGVGYPTAELIEALRRQLGLDRQWSVVLVGAGNLARALLRYRGFQQQGFRIVALVDSDAAKVGQRVDGLVVQPIERLAEVVAATGAELGLLTVPSDAAQDVAEALAAAGVRGILNFAPVLLRVPPQVQVVTVDLAVQLEQLAFLVQWSGGD